MFKHIYEFAQFDNIIVNNDNIKKIKDKLNVDEQFPILGMFNECVFIFNEDKNSQYIYYKQLNKDVVHVESYNYGKSKLTFVCSFDLDFNKDGNFIVDRIVNIKKGFMLIKAPKEQVRYYINYVVARYMGMVGYFHLTQKDRKIVVKDITDISKRNMNDRNKQNKPKSQEYRGVIIFDDIEVLLKTNNPKTLDLVKKTYTRHAESWGVRGHYRTLKSGKKVFIKAYTKGDKNKYKPKDYEVL